jgi:hypothetical protein
LRAPATFSPRWVIAMTDETLIRCGRGLAQVQRQPDGKPTFVSDMLDDLANGLEAARADLEKLKDPTAVHLNMLRGTVARISMANCAHTHGVQFNELEAAEAALADARADNERLREALKPFAELDIEGGPSGMVLTGAPTGMCPDITRDDVIRACAALSPDQEQQP